MHLVVLLPEESTEGGSLMTSIYIIILFVKDQHGQLTNIFSNSSLVGPLVDKIRSELT